MGMSNKLESGVFLRKFIIIITRCHFVNNEFV